MIHSTDKHRRHMEYEVGDPVFVKLRPYWQQSIQQRSSQKLASCYFSPYKITHKCSLVTNKLGLPQGSKIHSIFHISQMKKRTSSHPVSLALPHELYLEKKSYILEAILKVQGRGSGSFPCHQVLVQWQTRPLEESLWITCSDFRG